MTIMTLCDARKAMKRLFWQFGRYDELSGDDDWVESILIKLCQNHPSLAVESFSYLGNGERVAKLTPLTLLLQEEVELTRIQAFCRAFPEAVQQKDDETGNYPLHIACALSHEGRHSIQGGLIAFLVQLFPLAASTKNLQGNLPLHLLLLGSTASSTNNNQQRLHTICHSDVQALVECYPNATVMTSVDFNTTSLESVLETSHHFPQSVRDLVCRHVPSRVRFFQLGRQQSHQQPLSTTTRCIAMALSNLLPQLIVLECKRTDWDLDGWTLLLESLASNTSIRCLSLTLPNHLLSQTNEDTTFLLDPLQKVMSQNTGITRLSLIHRPLLDDTTMTTSMAMTCTMDFTTVIQNVLESNQIQSLTLVGILFDMKALYQAVSKNTSLVEWNLEGCGNNHYSNHHPLTTTTTATLFCRTSVDFSQLTRILQQHNTSLEKVVIPRPIRQQPCRNYDLLYWTALNRFGRKYVRKLSTNLEQMIALLATLRHQRYVIQQGVRVEMYQVRYGLLRESPSLWCCSQ